MFRSLKRLVHGGGERGPQRHTLRVRVSNKTTPMLTVDDRGVGHWLLEALSASQCVSMAKYTSRSPNC
jgi:hypothetical protein